MKKILRIGSAIYNYIGDSTCWNYYKNKNTKIEGGKNMLSKIIWMCVAVMLLTTGMAAALTPQEQLGKNLFFDTNLSEPAG